MIKISIKLLLFVIVLLFLSSIISNYDIKYNSLLRFILFFYLSAFSIKKYGKERKEHKIFLIIFSSYVLLEFEGIWVWINGGVWFYPIFIISIIGMISGYIYAGWKNNLNLLPFVLGSILTVFMLFQGWDYWFHRANFGTFTGKTETYKLQQKVEGIDENNKQISNQTFEKKIVLLDFWHTKCGVCFQKFPQLQAFYNKYKDDNSIAIYAVDKPIEEDKEKSAFKVIDEEGYNFPVLLPDDENLPEKFGVKGYPTTFVINRSGNVVYKGDIEGAIILVEELKRNE
jgi:thiol-disulfide isomerase/thioredoxin